MVLSGGHEGYASLFMNRAEAWAPAVAANGVPTVRAGRCTIKQLPVRNQAFCGRVRHPLLPSVSGFAKEILPKLGGHKQLCINLCGIFRESSAVAPHLHSGICNLRF